MIINLILSFYPVNMPMTSLTRNQNQIQNQNRNCSNEKIELTNFVSFLIHEGSFGEFARFSFHYWHACLRSCVCVCLLVWRWPPYISSQMIRGPGTKYKNYFEISIPVTTAFPYSTHLAHVHAENSMERLKKNR